MTTKLVFAIQSRLQRDARGIIRAPVGYARYEAWSGFLQAFDEVVLVSRVESVPDAKGAEVEGPGVTVMEAPYYRGLAQLARVLPRIQRFVRMNFSDPEMYYGARLPDLVGFLLSRQSRSIGASFLAQIVGDPAEVLRSGAGGHLGKSIAPLVKRLLQRTVQKADAVIYVTRRILQNSYPPAARALVLSRSNVELDKDSLAPAPRNYEKDLVRDPIQIVTAGSQEQNYKGHDLLIEAVQILNERGLRTKATIIGGGKFNSELKNQAAELRVTDRIRFLDRLPSANHVRRFVLDSDLFVLPSRTEGLPRVLIEAMATGTACLGARVGGVPELLTDNWTFEANDATALADAIESVGHDSQRLSAGASEQWKIAMEIETSYSGDQLLSDFLKRWTRSKE